MAAAETFGGGFDELLNDKNSSQAWEIPLQSYLEEYSKRLQEVLAADDGFSKLNFTEPAFIVSKAAKVWGRKVDSLDDLLHAILHRAVVGNNDSAAASEGSVQDPLEERNQDSTTPTQAENAPKKQKQKTFGWTLEDLRTLSDIVRPVAPTESDNIDLHKNSNEMEIKNTLRPRIHFDLHPVYRLPISIQIKNVSGDVMGDYYDFFSNTFDVEQVSKLLEGQTAGDRTLEMMDVDNEDNDENEVSIIAVENDLLFSEPVKLDANSEPIINLGGSLLAEQPMSQSTLAPNLQVLSSQESDLTSMPGLESQSMWEPKAKQEDIERENQGAMGRDRTVRVRGGTAGLNVTNKFLTRLDPYDTSMEAKKSKPLSKTPGKPYKLPNQKQKETRAPTLNISLGSKSDDIFSQHMPPLKPPPQMPASIADSVSVELSEQMVQKFNDNVLVACGRKSQTAATGRVREEVVNTNEELPLSQEVVELDNNNDDDDSDVEEVAGEPPALDLPGLTASGNDQAEGNDVAPLTELDVLPDVQNLEDMLPANVCDESRIKRIQDWDRYVETRLAAVERTPFDVNDYCVKMVACGQQAGKKKWFSLDQAVVKMVKEKEHTNNKNVDHAKLDLSVRREGARSLVSLLFLANSGNVEFRNKNSELEVRLMSETIQRVNVDARGNNIESPTHRVALTAQHQ